MKFNRKITILKISYFTFIFFIFFVFVLCFLKTVFFPKDINYYENRYCEKLKKPTITAFLDNSFQDSMEKALADQIPKAQFLKKVYNDLNSKFTGLLFEPIVSSSKGNYVRYKDMLFFNGHYAYGTSKMEYLKASLDLKTENYNKIFKSCPDVDFYVYYIEKDTDINFETGEKVNADEYLFSKLDLDADKKASYEINSFDDFSKYFYKTDHHWNHIGSYKAYKELIEFLSCDSEALSIKDEVLIYDNFLGSKAMSIGSSMFAEKFFVYTFDFPQFKIKINALDANDYGASLDFLSKNNVKDVSYGSYYGGDEGEIIFDSKNDNLENILIIGESYDNAILKLLASHYNKTHSIDLRYYEHYLKKKFNLKQYVYENNIDKVLFIGNIDFYILDTFELECN